MNDDPSGAPPLLPGAPRRRRAAARSWRVAILAAVALAPLGLAGYRAVVDRWLASEGARRLVNRRPDRLQIDWRRAVSPYPGLLEVEGLRLSLQTATARFRIVADRVEGWPDLGDLLLRRTLHAARIEAQGVSFHVARRLPPAATPTGREALAPPFSEFDAGDPGSRPPAPAGAGGGGSGGGADSAAAAAAAVLAEAVGPATPAPSIPRRGFRYRLPAIVLDELREVWIEEFRYRGPGRATVDLDLDLGREPDRKVLAGADPEPDTAPRRRLTIGPSRLDLGPGGTVDLGAARAFGGVVARLEAAVDPFVPREAIGWSLLERATGSLSARAHVESSAQLFELHVRPQVPWLAMRGGRGPVRFRLRLDHGRWMEGSEVAGSAREVEARFFGYTARGSGPWHWRVESGEAAFVARLDDYRLVRDGERQPQVVGQGLEVSLSGRASGGVEAFRALVPRSLVLPEAETPDVRVLNAYLPAASGVRLDAGAARLQAAIEATADPTVLRGDARVSGRHIAATVGGRAIAGEFDLHLVVPRLDAAEPRLDLAGSRLSLRAPPATGTAGAAASAAVPEPWGGEIEVPRGRLRGGDAPRLDADLRFSFRDSAPFVAWLDERRNLPVWLTRLALLRDPAGSARLRLTPRAMSLDDAVLLADGGDAELRARLARDGEARLDALVYARYKRLSVGLALRDGRRDWRFIEPRAWFERQRLPDPLVGAGAPRAAADPGPPGL